MIRRADQAKIQKNTQRILFDIVVSCFKFVEFCDFFNRQFNAVSKFKQ